MAWPAFSDTPTPPHAQVMERAEGLAGTSMRQGFHLANKEVDRSEDLVKSSGYQKAQVFAFVWS